MVVPTASDMPLPLDGVTVIALEHAQRLRSVCDPSSWPISARVSSRSKDTAWAISRAPTTNECVGYRLASYGATARRKPHSRNVKHPAAGNILARLLAKADVFVQNLAPGAAETPRH